MLRQVFETLEKMPADTDLGRKLRDACAAFESQAVATDASGPQLSVRALARLSSDPDGPEKDRLMRAKKERAEVWAKAVAVRKQHWQIIKWSSGGKAQEAKSQLLDQRSSSKVVVELNERHRGYFLSADLLGESSPPWAPGAFDQKHMDRLKALVSAVTELDGESSFVFAFDGRSRENRKLIEESFTKSKIALTEMAELWLSYDKGKQGNSREVFGADHSREVCFLKLPCPRVRLACKPRTDKHCRGDSPSTSDCVYHALPMAEQEQLPRIARDQKAKIMQLKEDAPPSWNSTAVPLFWSESVLLQFGSFF